MTAYPPDGILQAVLVGVACGADDREGVETVANGAMGWLRGFCHSPGPPRPRARIEDGPGRRPTPDAKRRLRRHPPYPAGELFARRSVVERLVARGDDSIFACEFGRCGTKGHEDKTGERRRDRFIAKVPLRDSGDAVLVNRIGSGILEARGVAKCKTSFVTSLAVDKSSVADIAARGRARRKIENESFNGLKNHGYEPEHNFGHGENIRLLAVSSGQAGYRGSPQPCSGIADDERLGRNQEICSVTP